jgi:hypothetical protein
MAAVGMILRAEAPGSDRTRVHRATKSSQIRIEIRASVLANLLIWEKRSADMSLRT